MKRLQDACKKNGPLCVGLDTDSSYIPPEILKNYSSETEAVLAYNKELIEVCSPFAGCFKVQIAYYEAMGLAGMKVFTETLKILRKKNIPFISDIKRGDIADTAKAYARAHFSGDFEADIITVNPYMGFDTLEPFTEYCKKENGAKGMFVLLRTSNPGMIDIEKQELAKGGVVLDHVGQHLLSLADVLAKSYGVSGDWEGSCSPIGAVVGCTEESDARLLRDKYPNIFFLIPGYGAQGGSARIAATLLDKAGGTVNSSRGILCAWKKDADLKDKRDGKTLTMDDIITSAQKAAKKAKEDLLEAVCEL
ncbi:MAG: orotidine-5'-phosphate decarboxylase [Treponema sp.]|nr:orotidine-5'-phosphate decarboxylase [Treponema sp.]